MAFQKLTQHLHIDEETYPIFAFRLSLNVTVMDAIFAACHNQLFFDILNNAAFEL